MYYGNNPKIQRLLDEVEAESEAAKVDAKKRFWLDLIRRNKQIVIIVVGFIGLAVFGFTVYNLLSPDRAYNNALKEVEATTEQVVDMINDGNFKGAKSKLTTFT